MMHDMDGWWWLWGALMMLIVWGGLIALVAWVARSLIKGDRQTDSSALQIAERRYASGEISREEFEQIRKDLSGGPVARTGPPD